MSSRLHTLIPACGLAALALLTTAAQAALPNTVTVRNFFGSMTFARPVHFVQYPANAAPDSTYIVVQQGGKLMTVGRQGGAWAKSDSAVLTVNGGTSSGNEQGLLGFAFHPQFATNRKYYVYYIASGSTQGGFDLLAERVADSTLRPKTSDAMRTLLRITDPYNNHNGGTMYFGPNDGYLYFGIGDGGNGGDPQGRAQNTDSLLGKFLRFDVDGPDAFPSDTTRNYAIPATNPFVGVSGYKPEIWAYGVRNPWKWSFHPVTGELWVGDVGQSYMEEVSRVPKGGNMGWRVREGNTCFNTSNNSSPLTSCTFTGMIPSVINQPRSKAQSITGGAFFAGDPSSAYHGVYFYGDYATDSLWAARIVNDSVTEQIKIGTLNTVASFNLDRQGRVFALNVDNGTVNILESPDMKPAATPLRPGRAMTGAARIRALDVARNPERYVLRDLDGRMLDPRALREAPTGAFFAIDRQSPGTATLLTVVP
jgi:glucose/arabinose dehydrogenase